MPVDPSPLIACAAEWRPGPGWADEVREPYARLAAGDDHDAWATFAMMFGDTGAAPLALVVCLHAERALGASRRLAAHRQLCMMDLGLASAPGPVKIGDLGEPGTVDERVGPLEAWLARALFPFDGDLARAARWALDRAAERLGL